MLLESLSAASLLLTPVSAGVARPQWCRPTAAAPVNLSLRYAPIKYDYTKSSNQLAQFDIDTVNPYGDHAHTIVGGLTMAQIRVEHQMHMGGIRYGDQSCMWIANVQMVIHLEPTVYVANKYKPGTCRFKSILEHEAKHVKVDQELAQRYEAVYEKAVVDAINQFRIIGPFHDSQRQMVQDDLAQFIRGVIDNVSKQFNEGRGKWQQAVDTRQEYDRVAALCPREPY